MGTTPSDHRGETVLQRAWREGISVVRAGDVRDDAALLIDDIDDLSSRGAAVVGEAVDEPLLDLLRRRADLLDDSASDFAEQLELTCRAACGMEAPSTRVHHLAALLAVERAGHVIRGRAPAGEGAACDVTLLGIATDSLLAARLRLVLVGGVSGSGKSVLARGLAPMLDADLLQSDVVRSEVNTTPRRDERYSDDAVRRVYDVLLERASEILARGRSVVLDATWLDPRRRTEAETTATDRAAELVEIECVAPRDLLAERVETRRREATDPSEATLEVLDEQLDGQEPWPDAVFADTGSIDLADPDALGDWVRRETGLAPLPSA